MQKNEQKARAHLARAQQLLQPKDRDALGFGGIDELNAVTLRTVLQNVNIRQRLVTDKVSKAFNRIGRALADELRKGILMKHHTYWEQHEHEQVNCIECVDSLERLCTSGAPVSEDQYQKTLKKVFSSFFETKPHELSAIDFVRTCVLNYPSPYSVLLVEWLADYLLSNSKGWASKKWSSWGFLHGPFRIWDINFIIEMIDHNYDQKYKSSVGVVLSQNLVAELQKIHNCCKTLIVHYPRYALNKSCVFVNAVKLHKSVFVLGNSDWQETKLLSECLDSLKSDPNYTFYQLEPRSLSTQIVCDVLAIEDSVRLFLNPDVPHEPDERAEPFWEDFPIVKIKHAPGSHLLAYSECFRNHNLGLILGKDSKYLSLYKGKYHSCLLLTYKLLYKLHVIRKTCLDGGAMQ